MDMLKVSAYFLFNQGVCNALFEQDLWQVSFCLAMRQGMRQEEIRRWGICAKSFWQAQEMIKIVRNQISNSTQACFLYSARTVPAQCPHSARDSARTVPAGKNHNF